jgi:hypothetical protein
MRSKVDFMSVDLDGVRPGYRNVGQTGIKVYPGGG